MTQKAKKYNAPALEKGLDIIELLASQKNLMTISDISNVLDRSKSEIFRMITTLEEREYIERPNGNDSYTLTNKIFELGMQSAPTSNLLEIAMPEMQSLATEIRQSCHLAILNKYNAVVISRIENPASIGFSVRAGHTTLANKSGSGVVLLSDIKPPHFNRIINNIKKFDDDYDEEKLTAHIKLIKENGYIALQSYLIENIVDISSPITRGVGGEIIACLSVPYTLNKNTPIKIEDIAKIVVEYTQKISALIPQNVTT